MSTIIDRRLNPRDKTIKNRQKFIQRSRDQIKKAVKDAIDNNNIADIENGKARVRVKGVNEPTFHHDSKTGDKKYVLPGNKEYVVGDKQDKQEEEGGGKGGGGLGEGEDDFEFVLNQQEFLDFIFEDMELPDLVKKQMKDVTNIQMKRAGYTNVGNPSQLDVVRSLKNSLGRRIGLGRPSDDEIKELEEKLLETSDEKEKARIQLLIDEKKAKQISVPWLDPFDVRYRNFTPTPTPMTKAVMFCVMDVSGSMGQTEKDIAKRFFFLLHMFLIRKYQKVEIVFIRHHEVASEVDEEMFFTSRESGGTVVSTAINLTREIIQKRYNLNDWNIYVAQASDGDNYRHDYNDTIDAMNALLPMVQYFAYVDIKGQYNMFGIGSDLWETYELLQKQYAQLAMRKVFEAQDIWKVFKELFSKETS